MAAFEYRTSISENELVHLGEGTVAYVREMESDDLKGKFPGLPEMRPAPGSGLSSRRPDSRSCCPTSASGRSPALSPTTS